MGIKDLLLNKGWAGTTFSRRETADRLNNLLRRIHVLNQTYGAAVRRLEDGALRERLNAFLKTSRVDVAKLSESILSAGGVPYNGTDLEPGQYDVGDTPADVVPKLRDAEETFFEAVSAEQKENHQIRSRAILGVVHTNSQERLTFLRGEMKAVRR